jgi:carboxylesterase
VLFAFLALALAAAYAARVAGVRRNERVSAARLRTGADGIIIGGAPIDLAGDPERGVLLLHGFGDTPQTLGYLASHLHRLGYSVRVPLLPGHGRSLREFARSDAAAWEQLARDELALMRGRHRDLAVIGLSMGGALASILLADASDVRALALISPYLSMPTRMRYLARTYRFWTLFTGYIRTRGERSVHDPAEVRKNLAYGMLTPRLLHELMVVNRRAVLALPRLALPTLMVQSRDDNRIPPEAAERAYARIGSPDKRLVWLEGCGHIVTVDYGREQLFATVADWLAEHMGSASRPSAISATRSAAG